MYNLLNEKKYARCVWPGAVLPLGESGRYMEKHFKDKFNVDIEYLEETKTVSRNDGKKKRIDQIFNVLDGSIDRFDEIKSQIGAFYAKEMVRNGEYRYYNERIYFTYFKRAEDELVKAGELPPEDVYQTKM